MRPLSFAALCSVWEYYVLVACDGKGVQATGEISLSLLLLSFSFSLFGCAAPATVLLAVVISSQIFDIQILRRNTIISARMTPTLIGQDAHDVEGYGGIE